MLRKLHVLKGRRFVAIAALSLIALTQACASTPALPNVDANWYPVVDNKPGPEPRRFSEYVTLRDGTKLAVDVWLPESAAGPLPVILQQTRYYRSFCTRWPFHSADGPGKTIQRFIDEGYAWVAVDARGTGASFGTWPYPWAPAEIRDGADVVDWIVKQPWSTGKVGTTGVSYDGTAAEFLLTNAHPAVKAAIPRFSLYDAYEDIAFPGGVHLSWFTNEWQTVNRALDENRFVKMLGFMPQLALCGARKVDADRNSEELRDAIESHARNGNVYRAACETTYADDVTYLGVSAKAFSPSTYATQLRSSGVPIYSYSGWFDGAYAASAIRRFSETRGPGHKLLIGPWVHGGKHLLSEAGEERATAFSHADEMLRFFDHYLKGTTNTVETEPAVRYFTLVENAWKTADSFPPPGFDPLELHLDNEGGLRRTPAASSSRPYPRDLTASSGPASRWRSLFNIFGIAITYPQKSATDPARLTFESEPVADDIEITGFPQAELTIRSDTPVVDIFAYLEDVAPDGTVHHISEGQFRSLHRKTRSFLRADGAPLQSGVPATLPVRLLPVSYRVLRGHRIRLALAAADADNFTTVNTPDAHTELLFGDGKSRLTLPALIFPASAGK